MAVVALASLPAGAVILCLLYILRNVLLRYYRRQPQAQTTGLARNGPERSPSHHQITSQQQQRLPLIDRQRSTPPTYGHVAEHSLQILENPLIPPLQTDGDNQPLNGPPSYSQVIEVISRSTDSRP